MGPSRHNLHEILVTRKYARAVWEYFKKGKDDAECKQKFQLLSQVARKYLATSASSSPSETVQQSWSGG